MDREPHQPSYSGAAFSEQDITSESKELADVQQLSPNTLKVAAAECLNNWIGYLQMLNTMCAAGLRLAQSLYNLSQMQNVPIATQCINSWEDLTRATAVASSSVKNHIAAAMQDMSIGDTFTESDAQRQLDHNQHIITENLLTFINLQYQFSIASCENFGSMALCPSCQTTPGGVHNSDCSMAAVQQCFSKQETRSQMSSPRMEDIPRQHSPMADTRGSSPYQEQARGPSPIHSFSDFHRGPGPLETLRGPFPTPGQLHTMKLPFPGRGGQRSPLHFPLFPLGGPRRWSEVAATDVTVVSEGGQGEVTAARRWSMPWDTAWVGGEPPNNTNSNQNRSTGVQAKLSVPSGGPSSSQERSRSTTPESVTSQPSASAPSGSQPPVPGVLPSVEGLSEAIQLLSCRPSRSSIPTTSIPGHSYVPVWGETHEDRMHRRLFPSQRGNWQSVDVPHAGNINTDHFDIFPQGLPLTSRKSSSSTDSSSCMSIHSRSTNSGSERGSSSEASGPEAIRLHTNLYSMWSGSEHLPFIRLPESQEPLDESDTDDPPTERSGFSGFPKPT
ncbi:uncharacterized protein LOC126735581 [Anthonomus grandis grandis]|uniref:uncharacterized protein LOC126735581 n=1 Tax=Anthonomus grandis grandis TaxID=2921223 RepID=UPI002165F0C7|nr:uncharacterized protein LOC126735581 [Anthonomus grandis grandis]